MIQSKNMSNRMAGIMFIIACVLVLIYFASDIISPLICALFLAVLLRPIAKFLNEKLRIPNLIAIGLSILLMLSVLVLLVFFMGKQISAFIQDLPVIQRNVEHNIGTAQQFIYKEFGWTYSEQKDYLDTTVSEAASISTSSFSSITNSLMFFVLIPIYTFLILNYRSLLLGFLLKLVPKKDIPRLQHIISEVKSVIRSYISGLLIEVVIVSCLTGLGLWAVGVPYFVFLGVMTGILNLIPYVGILVACVISTFVAMSGSTDLSLIIGVVIVNVVVQFIDNNILIPKVVGSKVSINALASMVSVVIGGSLAGIAGMFLAIPIIAVLKVIFDHSTQLAPFGYLLGDDIPKSFDWNKIRIPLFVQREETNNDVKNGPEV